MKPKKKRVKRRKRRNQKLIVVAIILFLATLVVALALNKSNPEKKPANEYFSISKNDIEPLGFTHNNGTVLELLSLTFKLTAVGGDAHTVFITAGVFSSKTIDIIKKGETETIELVYSPRLHITKLEEEGFLVEMNIWSMEAKGKIKIHIPPDDVIPRD